MLNFLLYCAQSQYNKHRQFLNFILISGTGWIFDMLIFSSLIYNNLRPLFANMISSFCGLTYSYLLSSKYIFYNNKEFLIIKFALYIITNIISVLFFSNIIDLVTISFISNPVIIKCGITPLTLLTNFMILSLMNKILIKDVL